MKGLIASSFVATKRRLRKATMAAMATAIEADIADWIALGKARG